MISEGLKSFKMFRILVLCCCLAGALSNTVVLNEAVDQFLQGFRTEVINSGQDELAIPDMKNDWKYRWHFLKLSGHVNCGDGKVKSLASLHRTGDVSMTVEGNKATLKLALGFGELEARFGHCQFKAKRLFSVTRKITASVSSNSVEAQISLVKNGEQCIASVDQIGLNNLGKVKISTGGGVLHKIEGKILTWVTKHFHEKIVNGVNSALRKAADSHIHKADLCSKLPF